MGRGGEGEGGGGGRVLMELLPFSFDVLQYLENDFSFSGKPLILSTRYMGYILGVVWRRWRTVTSALNMVAILDFISIWHKYHE